jgi:hypothetical protein
MSLYKLENQLKKTMKHETLNLSNIFNWSFYVVLSFSTHTLRLLSDLTTFQPHLGILSLQVAYCTN